MGSTEISKNRYFRVRVLSRPDSLHAPYLEKFAAMNSARYTEAEAGAGFKSLADAWADTTTPHGKLISQCLGNPVQSHEVGLSSSFESLGVRGRGQGLGKPGRGIGIA